MKREVESLKVLSYNIHKGFRTGGKRFVLQEMRELLRTTRVDLVFLQEVIGENTAHAKSIDDWPETSQYEYLADTVWNDHSYGRNAVHEDGHHGNAILSRFPIVSWENVDISTNRLERRGLLHTRIKIDDCIVHACCTHLNLTKRGRNSQLKQLCSWIGRKIPGDAPLILAGDFNDWTNKLSEPLEKELGLKEVIEVKHGRLHPTFPASLPVFNLDRIYVRGLDISESKILKGKTWRKLSDHIPVQATLRL